MPRTRPIFAIALTTATAWIGSAAPLAQAGTLRAIQDAADQQEGPDITEAGNWIVEQELAAIAETVLLTPDQLALVREMKMEGDRQVYAEMKDGWISEEKRQELIDAQDWEALNHTWDSWRRVNAKREEVMNTFTADLKLILNDDQLSRFESVERRWRREELFEELDGVNFGLFDLHAVVHEMELDQEHEDALQEVLATLEVTFDHKVAELRELMLKSNDASREAYGGGELEPEKAMKELAEVVGKILEKGEEIRDLSRDATAQAAALLPPEIAQDLTRRAKIASFPKLYESGPVEGMLERVSTMQSLNEDQLARLDEIRKDYYSKVGQARDRVADDITRFFEGLTTGKIVTMLSVFDPEQILVDEFKDTSGPLAGLYNATARRIYQLLSPEQREGIEEPKLLEPKDIFKLF